MIDRLTTDKQQIDGFICRGNIRNMLKDGV